MARYFFPRFLHSSMFRRYLQLIPLMPRSLRRGTASEAVSSLLADSFNMSDSVTCTLDKWHKSRQGLSAAEHVQVFHLVSHETASLKDDENFQALYEEAGNSLGHLTADQIIQFLWLVAARMPRIEDSQVLVQKAVYHLEDKPLTGLSDSDLGLLMLSLQTLRRHQSTKSLVDKVAQETVLHLQSERQFTDQKSLTRICCVLAKLKQWPPDLTEVLASYILRNKGNRASKAICQLAWSMHTAKVHEQSLIEVASRELLDAKCRRDPKIVLQMLTILGETYYYDETLYKDLSEFVLSEEAARHWYQPQIVSRFLWCLSRVRYYDPLLMDHLSDVAVSQLRFMSSKDLSTAIFSFGFFNHPCYGLLNEAVRCMLKLPWNGRAILNVLRSCLIMEHYPRELIELFFCEKFKELRSSCLASVQLQLDIATRVECPHLSLPRFSFQERAEKLLLSSSRLRLISSRTTFHTTVCTALKQLIGDDLVLPEVISPTGYSMDAEILLDSNDRPVHPSVEQRNWSIEALKVLSAQTPPVDEETVKTIAKRNEEVSDCPFNLASDWIHSLHGVSRRICIEADGPVHYAVNRHHALGGLVLKKRQLRKLGWEVVQIPYYEWEELGFCADIDNHVQYLKNRIFTK